MPFVKSVATHPTHEPEDVPPVQRIEALVAGYRDAIL
jgi:hypothetical protein